MRRTGGISVSGAMLLVAPWIASVSLLSGPAWARAAGTKWIPADDSAVSIAVEDRDGASARFVDGQKAETITGPNSRSQIQGPAADFIGGHALFVSDTGFGTDGGYMVASSEGVTCARTGGGQRVAGDEEAAPADDGVRTADELASLSCDELLVLFRTESGSGQQYEDAAGFPDSEVRVRVEACPKEIVAGPDGRLPKTGGLSLLALAILGVVSAAAGLSVIRGGQR